MLEISGAHKIQTILLLSILLFICVHSTPDSPLIKDLLTVEIFSYYKAIFFGLLILSLIALAFKELVNVYSTFLLQAFVASVAVYFFYMLTLSPTFSPQSMGEVYEKMSGSPFSQTLGWYYRRLLHVAIPFFLKSLNIKFIYFHYFFLFFSVLSFSLLVFQALQKRRLRIIGVIVLGSFLGPYFYYHLKFPGYPDPLALGLYTLTLAEPTFKKLHLRLPLIALSLSCGEQIIFTMFATEMILAFLQGTESYTGKISLRTVSENIMYPVGLLLIYLFIWFLLNSFNAHRLIESQTQIGTTPAYQFPINNPLDYLAGIFYSFKFFWFLPVIWIASWRWATYEIRGALTICALFVGLVATIVAVDTSRIGTLMLPLFLLITIQTVRSKKLALILIVLAFLNLAVKNENWFVHTGKI